LIFSVAIIFSTLFNKYKKVELLGSGAIFPLPLYQKLFEKYSKLTKVKVNYQGIGSGAGIKQFMDKTLDFGASDIIFTDENIKNEELIYIPTFIGAVVLGYNLQNNTQIKLSPEIISRIYLGKITKWNDPMIQKENEDIKLPDLNITVITRSDSSGTTYIFTEYLSKVSEEWKERVGKGISIEWPVGISGKGNTGVAGLITQVKGSIGYLELMYAVKTKISYAKIKNKQGNYIFPNKESILNAFDLYSLENKNISFTDTSLEEGYPIRSLTWIVIYKEQKYNNRKYKEALELVTLLLWIIDEGQKYVEEFDYISIPEILKNRSKDLLYKVTYDGKEIIK